MRSALKFGFAAVAIVSIAGTAIAQEPPAAGVSPRVDAIKKAGVLKVGVLANLPWLAENTSGSGEAWYGPAWTLSKEYAKLLGVKLQPVLVSHETKVPVLAANQVDLSITALAAFTRPAAVRTSTLRCRFSISSPMRRASRLLSATRVAPVSTRNFTLTPFTRALAQ